MKEQTFGSMIAMLRKKKGMTQLELAEKIGVTDKAVSKWERNLSFPDVGSIPKLAEILDVSVDELMQVTTNKKEHFANNKTIAMVHLALKGIALAMGIAVSVLSFMHDIDTHSAISMLGIGLACLTIVQLAQKDE